MRITFDPAKRRRTLLERGLDFEDASSVFAGVTADRLDLREDYGEERTITVGHLRGDMVVVVWTQRGPDVRHVFSMRYADDDEEAGFRKRLRKGRRARDRLGR